MIIQKIKIENYRLLKNFSIDLEKELSLVLGKNNTGKTSLLSVLDKFLNTSDRNKFSFDDFNLDFKNILRLLINSEVSEELYVPKGINLKLFIEYDESDNLENVSKVMMDLDPDNNFIVLSFAYTLDFYFLTKLKSAFIEFKQKEESKKTENPDYDPKDVFYFLRNNYADYFKTRKKSIAYDPVAKQEDDSDFIDIEEQKISIKEIINFKYISAKRSVTNNETDKTLSFQTSKIYKKTETTDNDNVSIEKFKDQLIETDDILSRIYTSIFENTIEKVKKFGGIEQDDSIISIESTLQHRELLEGNTTVFYDHHGTTLPEYNNGLGYMNLISMIFEIEILLQEFKKDKNEKPSDINLLFIEEPEAHTHPQMQYIFIKNIKDLLGEGIKREDGQNRELQTIITTHSSHIVSESDFDDIKYLKKEEVNGIVAKNLTELKEKYAANPKHYEFLSQYLTLNRAEIFFADKAILIEGDTERILLPAFMKKFDIEDHAAGITPLLSQNISIIEVGAYAQIFEYFIDFIGIKSLIITDLDTVDDTGEKCRVREGINTSNGALKHFFGSASLDDLKGYSITQKTLKKDDQGWSHSPDGNLCIVYQVEDDGINARSFEESFIQINRAFIDADKDNFRGLKNRRFFNDAANDSYKLAEDCINKKTHFALDILYQANKTYTNWQTPLYIKEGLQWLKQK